MAPRVCVRTSGFRHFTGLTTVNSHKNPPAEPRALTAPRPDAPRSQGAISRMYEELFWQ
jgi:hypothetical protein